MASVKKKKKEITDEDKLLKTHLDNVNEWYRYYAEHIERARNYLTFLYVDQWDVEIRQERESQSKPTLIFNQITPIIRSVLGEQRNNSPALTVRPMGKDVTQKDLDVRDNLIRQIHYNSDADIVYQIASKHALECGWGAARVCIEYEDENSFYQCLYVRPITDFQSAFWDPSAQLPDKSDGDFCGVYTVVSKDKFKKLHPTIDNPVSAPSVGSNYYLRWTGRDEIIICEVYYKEFYTKILVQLSDGKELEKKDADDVIATQEMYIASNPDYEMQGFEPLSIVNERNVKCYKIKHIKFIQDKLLESTDWPGQILPIVYFEGDSTVIDGERIPLPFVQDGIDQQKLINYIGSEAAYAMVRARKETVMATPAMTAGFEMEWRDPGKVQGVLPYNSRNGEKPEFITPPIFNPGIMDYFNNVSQSLNQSLGRFEEGRGQQSNAISSLAIESRKSAENKPVNIWDDNWKRGIRQIGKVLLDVIPFVYDTHRTVMGMGADEQSKPMEINKPMGFVMDEQGEIDEHIENDMSKGKYDIQIRVDGSYDAQQAQAMQILIDLARVNPGIANLIPDLLAENSGLENSQKLVERLKTLLPPDILEKEEGKPLPPPQPPPPDPQMEIEKMKLQMKAKELEGKDKQMAIEEQKLMLEAKESGMAHQVGLAKAQAEIEKVFIDKDIAKIKHATAMHSAHQKLVQNHQRNHQRGLAS